MIEGLIWRIFSLNFVPVPDATDVIPRLKISNLLSPRRLLAILSHTYSSPEEEYWWLSSEEDWTLLKLVEDWISSLQEETSIGVHQSLRGTPCGLQDRNKPVFYKFDVPDSLSQWRKKSLGQLRTSWKASSFFSRDEIGVLFKSKSDLDIDSHDSENVALDYNWPRLNGGRDIFIWKENQGSSKSWRVCTTVKHNSKAFDISSLKAKHGNVICPWVQASTSAPVAYLKARKNFRQYQRLKQNSPQQERKTGRRHRCSVIRFHLRYVSTGSYLSDVDYSLVLSQSPQLLTSMSEELSSEETKITHYSHSHKALGSWHSVLKKTKSDSMTPICSSKIIIPSENFIGTVLGGQFQLGRLVRYEKFADVYEITPLLVVTESRMEALAYDMKNHPRASKRDIDHRAPFVLCQIDQSGKKYLVYHVNERKQHELGRRATKNKNRREKQRNAVRHSPIDPTAMCSDISEDEDVRGQTLSPTEKQIFPAEKKEKTSSVDSLNRNREQKKRYGQDVAWITASSNVSYDISRPRNRKEVPRPDLRRPHWQFLTSEAAPKFRTPFELNEAIESLFNQIDEVENRLNKNERVRIGNHTKSDGRDVWMQYLHLFKTAAITLSYRLKAYWQLRKEFQILSKFSDLIADDVDHGLQNVDAEWQMRKCWPSRCSSPLRITASSSARFTMLLFLLEQPSLRSRLERIAEDLDVHCAISMRNLWEKMMLQALEGNLDAWLWGLQANGLKANKHEMFVSRLFYPCKPHLFWGLPLVYLDD